MFTKLKNWRDAFIEDCRHWWKLWSSWLAILWGFIVAIFWNSPEALQEIVNVLPDETRAILSPLVIGIVAGLPIAVRLLKQHKLIDQLKNKEGEK
jgi:hypothetical protein